MKIIIASVISSVITATIVSIALFLVMNGNMGQTTQFLVEGQGVFDGETNQLDEENAIAERNAERLQAEAVLEVLRQYAASSDLPETERQEALSEITRLENELNNL